MRQQWCSDWNFSCVSMYNNNARTCTCVSAYIIMYDITYINFSKSVKCPAHFVCCRFFYVAEIYCYRYERTYKFASCSCSNLLKCCTIIVTTYVTSCTLHDVLVSLSHVTICSDDASMSRATHLPLCDVCTLCSFVKCSVNFLLRKFRNNLIIIMNVNALIECTSLRLMTFWNNGLICVLTNLTTCTAWPMRLVV